MVDVMVRVPEDLIAKLKEMFPELAEEGNAFLVRTAIRKLILSYEATQTIKS